MEILSFFAGVLFFYTHSYLLPLCLVAVLIFRPCWRFFVIAGLGYGFAWFHQFWTQDQSMPQQAVIRQAMLNGVIASIPKQNPDKTQFEFVVQSLNNSPVKARMQINCYRNCPQFHVGERWTLRSKIHEVHNLNNPGGFDYKTQLATKHIHWVGYILRNGMHKHNVPCSWSITLLREHLANYLAMLLSHETTLGIVQALTIGVTTHINQASWALFRCTGTTHLMVISGAHIGLVAGMIFKLAQFLWSRNALLCLYFPAQRFASLVAIFISIVYALIAGLGAPAERATVAAGFIFLRYLSNHTFSSWQAWRYALLAVILTEPHVVLLPGFYLSFLAVGILLTMNKRILHKKLGKALGIQMSCMLGLLPFTVYWFSYGAVNGLFANMLAIPWVSFLIVPLSFICLCLGKYLPWLTHILDDNIDYFLLFLKWFDHVSWMNMQMSYRHIFSPIAGLLGLSVFLFLPIRRLWLFAITLLVVALYPSHITIPDQEFKVDVLDVGQGLAVVVQTHQHVLLYDTGGKNYQGSDMGKMVILPYLRYMGLQHVDRVIVSHPDLDHRGGLDSIAAAFPKADLIVDNPAFYKRGLACHAYPDWTWEGVRFHFFSLPNHLRSTNNHSCVLQISNSSGQILLTGDIEKTAEQVLINQYGQALRSDVLLIPHHGSQTSSSLAFLRTVAPKYAVFSYGFDNRYHFPHAKVLQRYQKLKIKTLATVDQGMITLRFQNNGLKINMPSLLT